MTEGNLALPIELLGSIERYVVYRFFSDQGQLLYVGETGDLGKRLAGHAEKLWFVQVRGITLEWYADEQEALKVERRAIHVEHPKYNVQHRSLRTLKGTPPEPRIRQPRKVADLIKRHPEWDNRKIAAQCGVHVRTVQRRRREMQNRAGVTVRQVERVISDMDGATS
jgi:predicted GIY-YIG superfamily endonuclease